jgi:DNA-binding transcriptional regulator YiaG
MSKRRPRFEELVRRVGPLPVTALMSAESPPSSAKNRGAVSRDFLDEILAQRSKKNARFPALVAGAERRLVVASALAGIRERLHLSQSVVAARMGTAASVVSRLEAGGNVKLSILQRYCAAIGQELPPKGRSRRQISRAA